MIEEWNTNAVTDGMVSGSGGSAGRCVIHIGRQVVLWVTHQKGVGVLRVAGHQEDLEASGGSRVPWPIHLGADTPKVIYIM